MSPVQFVRHVPGLYPEERHPSPLPKEDGPGASEFTREYDGGTDCQNGQLGLLLSKYPVFR